MKTRVVRYWHKADWLYKVEEYRQATGDEQWVSLDGPSYSLKEHEQPPKAGEWHWSWIAGGISREKALDIAHARSKCMDYIAEDVIAEFGE